MKAIVPWPFQKKTVRRALAAMADGKRTLIVSPGGSGKTVMAGMLVLAAARKARRVLMISHRREILRQTYDHLIRMGISERDVGLIYGDAPFALVRPAARIQIASVQALFLRERPPRADVVIVDECHRVMAPGYLRLVGRYKRSRHIGLTATPFRLDGVGLGNFYEEMIIAATPPELIAQKRLARPVIFSAMERAQPDLRSVRIARGDYLATDLEPKVMRPEIVGGLAEHWSRHARGRRSMSFGVTIAHSKAMDAKYRAAGIRSEHVDGEMPRRQRDEIITGFRKGAFDMLCSCDLLIEGFDLPECDVAVLARPTTSLAIVLQQSARVMRYHKGPRPVLLDHARLFPIFGLPDAERPYELTKGHMSPAIRNPEPIRICSDPNCLHVFRAGEPECPECGAAARAPEPTVGGGGGGGRLGIPLEIEGTLTRYSEAEKQALTERLEAYAKEAGLPRAWIDQVLALWVGMRAA
jgi:superfamily II DNA or RNA helicase